MEGSAFKVDSFIDDLVALQNFKTDLYDLAILDLKMPVMNGIGLYQEIRKLDDKVNTCFLAAASVYPKIRLSFTIIASNSP